MVLVTIHLSIVSVYLQMHVPRWQSAQGNAASFEKERDSQCGVS